MSNGVRRYDYIGEEQGQAVSGQAEKYLLFHFPSLEKLLTGSENRALAGMRARLEGTSQMLQRVIRQGPREDVRRAEKALAAWQMTLAFLQEMENGSVNRS